VPAHTKNAGGFVFVEPDTVIRGEAVDEFSEDRGDDRSKVVGRKLKVHVVFLP
jgi:hypothetical protein